MRILAVLRARSSGGSPRSLADVLGHLVSANDVWLATTDDEPGPGAPTFDPRIRHVRLAHAASTSLRIGAQAPVVRRLRRAIRDLRPDVVLSWGTWANFVSMVARVGLSVPVVVNERVDSRERGGALRQSFRTAVYRLGRPEAFVVPSVDLAAWAGRVVPRERVSAIPNVARFEPTGSADVVSSRVIVAAGRLVHQKGFDLLIRAFAASAKSRPEWTLRICGEGEDRPKLEALAGELGIESRVDMPGFASKLGDEFAAAAFFVLSSRFEGFPRVAAEALAAGLPVIAFDCPTGAREIVRNEIDGLVVPPEDVAALSAAMARFMDDPTLRSRMAARAPEVIERLDPTKIFARWDAVLLAVAR